MASNRFNLPFQKRYKYDGAWITMNRKIGEAIVNQLATPRPSRKKSWKPTGVQKRRRNAIAVVDSERRLMSNGLKWPEIDDYVMSFDNRIRYVPLLEPLRKIKKHEWTLQDESAEDDVFSSPTTSVPTPIIYTVHDELNTSSNRAPDDNRESKTPSEKASCTRTLTSSSRIVNLSYDDMNT